MKVTVSTAVSADGYLDDRSPDRLILSTPEDWAEVHRLRAACDAILVGAETIRRDNPSLLVGDEVLRRERIDRGLSPDPVKVTLTASCRLSPEANFFTRGDQEKDRLHLLLRPRSPAAGGDGDTRRRDHGCSDRYRT